MRSGDPQRQLAPAIYRWANAWSRHVPRRDGTNVRRDVEQAIGDVYRRSGLKAPGVAWCEIPSVYLAVTGNPQAHGWRLRAGAPLPIRLWSWRPPLLWAMTQILVALAVSLGVLAGALTIWVAATVLSYNALARLLGQSGDLDSAPEDVLFLVCLLGSAALLWRTVPWLIDATIRVRSARRSRAWHARADVSEALDPEGEVGGLPWLALRRVAVVLAPPSELGVVYPGEGHRVVTASWPDGVRHVFVDGERVPKPPGPGEAGRQGELFARDWVERCLTAPEDGAPVQREEVERAVTSCYLLVGLEQPSMLWCRTPQEYEAALLDPLGALSRGGVGGRRGRPAHVVAPAHRSFWTPVERAIAPEEPERGPGRRQLETAVGAADVLRGFLRRSFEPAILAHWRWLLTVRATSLPDEADDRGDALLSALERTARVPWTALRRVAVLLEPPPTVLQGEVGVADGTRSVPTRSIGWPDGTWWHLLDGVRVPRAADGGDWTVEEIHQVGNSEARRVLIEVMGWERYLSQASLPLLADVPDPANPPHRLQLYRLAGAGWDDVDLLVMTNASPGLDGRIRRFAEFVPAEFSDPVEAAAWQYGVPVEVYRAIQRRT